MSEFIVLGLVPGTHMAISFALWLVVMSALGTLFAVRAVSRSQALRAGVVSAQIALLTRRRLLV